MKIKKTKMMKTPASEGVGGAAIADRFKLDPVDTTAAPRNGYISKNAATTALVFGLVALAVTVTLTVMIIKHWDFLRLA